jgi:hypothetical protein
MHVYQRHQVPAPARLLVAADSGIDAHRVVKLCSHHAQADGPSVSLLVPVEIDPSPSPASPARVEEMLRVTTRLLDWAGIRLEEITLTDHDPVLVEQVVGCGDFDRLVVCSAHGSDLSPVLGLAMDVARRQGLPVMGDGRPAGASRWIRSIAGVLLESINPPWPRAA